MEMNDTLQSTRLVLIYGRFIYLCRLMVQSVHNKHKVVLATPAGYSGYFWDGFLYETKEEEIILARR